MQISALDQIEGTQEPTSAIPIYNFVNETNTFVHSERTRKPKPN